MGDVALTSMLVTAIAHNRLKEAFKMQMTLSVLLTIVAIIHLMPLVGVISRQRINSGYGIDTTDSNVAILMRHRAVLFGLLVTFLLCAAWLPSYQGLGLLVGFISVISFLLIAWAEGGVNPQVQRVVAADYVALACLILGSVSYYLSSPL